MLGDLEHNEVGFRVCGVVGSSGSFRNENRMYRHLGTTTDTS